jgi:hypothetical protein
MPKLSAFALFACLAMTVVSTGADAATPFRGHSPPPATPNGSQATCIVNCLQITPHPHADCAAHPLATLVPIGKPIIVNNPKKDPCASASSDIKACGEKLGNLRRVTVAQVQRIDDNDKIHLVPMCDNVHRSLTEVETTYLARGNVQGLILPISQNGTLMAALDDGGYRADNVLGIVRSQDMVILYVSRAPL